MRCVFIGPNGSGKTTVARTLAEYYKVPYLSGGEVLRSPDQYPWLKDIIGDYDVHSGVLLNDIALCAIAHRLVLEPQCAKGWVFDGVPRKLGQLAHMLAHYPPDVFIVLTADYETIQSRLSSRGRLDDAQDIIKKRFDIYETETTAMISTLHSLNTLLRNPRPIITLATDDRTPEEVFGNVLSAL